jgi:hypothetical protein
MPRDVEGVYVQEIIIWPDKPQDYLGKVDWRIFRESLKELAELFIPNSLAWCNES